MIFDTDGALQCPECNDIHTHLDAVVVHARPHGEDNDAVGITVRDDGRMSVVAHDGIGRRTAIEIVGECEQGHPFRFLLTQHKGTTFLT